MRMCPKCYSVYFPHDQTFAFYGCLSDKTRRLWLEDLLKKNVADPDCAAPVCIDHGEPLVQGKIPHYGFNGYLTNCCKMYHFPPSGVVELLKWTIGKGDISDALGTSKGKSHFFFVRWLDSLVTKLFGEKMPDEDPLDAVQYSLNLKKFFE